MVKRYRVPAAKPGELLARYGRVDRHNGPSIVYAWGAGGACKADSRVLSSALEEVLVHNGKTLAAVLIERGYDIETLRFSIRRLRPTPTTDREG